MNTKFTPGPWRSGDLTIVTDETLRHIAVKGSDIYDHDEAVANARLIAAAPDLYRLVEDIGASLTADNTYRLLREACRAVLAKARGDA